MSLSFLSDLVRQGGFYGLLLAICIIAIISLYRTLLMEKDKQIKHMEADGEHLRDEQENIVLVIKEIDQTQKAVLLELQHLKRR